MTVSRRLSGRRPEMWVGVVVALLVGHEGRAATEAFVSDNGADAVVVFDAASAAPLASIPVEDGPLGLAASPDGGLLYVGHFGPLDQFLLEFDAPGDAVSVIDTATRQVVDRIAMPCDTEASCRPVDVAVTPDGEAVLVTHRCSVSIIDAASRTVRATVPVHEEACGPPRPAFEQRRAQLGGIAVDAAGRRAYAVSGVETLRNDPANVVIDVELAVTTIDIAAGTIVPRVIDLGRASRPGLSGADRDVVAFPAIALSADGTTAYVSHPLQPQLRRFDVAAQELGAAIAIDPGTRPSGLAFTRPGGSLYASIFEPRQPSGSCPVGGAACPTLLRVDVNAAATTPVALAVDPGLLGSGVAVAPGGARAWVVLTTGRGGSVFEPSGAVAIVDTNSDANRASIAFDGTPGDVAFVTRFACVGDCDADGTVRVDELLLGVNALLGLRDAASCASFDADGSGQVEVAELILAVNAVLNGCVGDQ